MVLHRLSGEIVKTSIGQAKISTLGVTSGQYILRIVTDSGEVTKSVVLK